MVLYEKFHVIVWEDFIMNVSSPSLMIAPVQKYTKLQEQLLSKILQSVAVATTPSVSQSSTQITGIGTNIDLRA